MGIRISGLYARVRATSAAGRLAGVLLAVGALISVPGGANAGKTTSVNVTTIVHDTSTSGAQLLIRSDDYNDPGLAEATYGAASNFISQIYGGEYFLRLYSQTIRTLYITPNDAINNSQPVGPSPGLYWDDVEVAANCFDQNLNQVPFENILTSSGNCLMIVDFYSGGIKYKLAMGPSLTQTLQSTPKTAPATGLVTVTCNSSTNGQCVNWTITPNATTDSSNPPTVADLFYYSKAGPLLFIGQYYDTFRIDLTNP